MRDFGILGVCLGIGWKGRGLIQPGIDLFKRANSFFDRAELHMTSMEGSMNHLLNNHLAHLAQPKIELVAEVVNQEKSHASQV